ncbi:MAG TPA: PAS domain-containing protein, partial [Geomonas sp.]
MQNRLDGGDDREERRSCGVPPSDGEESRELLNAVLEAIPHPIYLKDSAGVFLNCNGGFADFIGVDKARIIGHSAGELYSPELSCWSALAETGPGGNQGNRDRRKEVRRAGGASVVLLFGEAPLL